MTKKELKIKYQEWNRNITSKSVLREDIFRELQELNFEHGDGVRYCSIEHNVLSLFDTRYRGLALSLYAKYNEINGEINALNELAYSTHNFE